MHAILRVYGHKVSLRHSLADAGVTLDVASVDVHMRPVDTWPNDWAASPR